MPFAANAAGLGKLTVISGLGEPLNAEIELLSTTPEELSTLTAAIAPEEAYAVQGLERDAVQNSIKVEVDKKPNGTPVLKLSTHQPVNDPFLDMLIQVDWATGRLLREYTALLDPPGYSAKSANGSAAINAPTVQSGATTEAGTADNGASAQTSAGDVKPAPGGAESSGRTASGSSEEEKPTEAPQEEYTTVAGDTLSSVARRMQVEGVSLEQMLVGLYNANEEAFAGRNMNRLKVGQIIRVPSPEELQSVSRSEAAKQIRVQTVDWNAYRNKLAGIAAAAAPAAEDTDAQTSGGKITAAAEDKAAPAAPGPRDVVKLSKSDSAGMAANGDKAMQERINSLQEEVTAKEKAAQEANERTAMLEKQIADMQKLLAVKNQALAEMQKNAGAGAPPATKQPEPAKEAAKPAVPAEPTKPVPAPAAVPEAPKAAPAPAQSAAPAAKPAAPVAKPRKRVAPPPPPPPEPGLLDGLMEDPTMLAAAGGGLVLLAGGWLFLRNRRRRNLDSFEQGILTAGGLKANTVFGNTAGGTVDTGDTSFLTDFSQSGGGMIDTHDVDPIAEAEVYMAYGRDAQAEEILKDAIAKEPQRYELHLKLLEILANRKDTAAFETIAGELYSTLGSGDPIWIKVAELGRQLEPGNPLYDTKGIGVAAAAGAAVAAGGASKLEASDFENVEELSESSLDFSMDTDAPGASSAEAETPAEAEPSGMDFDLGSMGGTEPEPEKPLSEMTTMSDSIFGVTQPQPEEEPAPEDLQFNAPESSLNEEVSAGVADFGSTVPGLEMPDLEAASDTGLNVAAAEQAPAAPATEEDAGLNFEMPELQTEETMEPEAVEELPSFGQTLMESSTADNEISFDAPAEEAASLELPALDQSAGIESEEIQVESNDLDFNFDTMLETTELEGAGDEEEETPNPPEIDLSGISLDFGPTIDNPEINNDDVTANGQFEVATEGESPEVETKLDLVTAYMEMGDKEGARELLDEVLKEGGPGQKERAQQMLNSIG